MTDSGELSEPVQEGSGDATREQKIAGLARQVAADLTLRPQEDLLAELRSRLFDAGITVDENELIAIAGTIALGEQPARLLAERALYSGTKNLRTDLLVEAERFYDQGKLPQTQAARFSHFAHVRAARIAGLVPLLADPRGRSGQRSSIFG